MGGGKVDTPVVTGQPKTKETISGARSLFSSTCHMYVRELVNGPGKPKIENKKK